MYETLTVVYISYQRPLPLCLHHYQQRWAAFLFPLSDPLNGRDSMKGKWEFGIGYVCAESVTWQRMFLYRTMQLLLC
ncbi:hypothetical protein KDH_03230 [Dictyobacter sp. S3.2.2.5]|uniref:Uncharacterized protein n=1 Tax=Dictyobacter halimunensis TaxID=3026934 RepID=A0ABQ6FHG3_9CHLR|nr:hypothetical protein KDH_03230 [Dictyobacter sp. S3.2.2.5]